MFAASKPPPAIAISAAVGAQHRINLSGRGHLPGRARLWSRPGHDIAGPATTPAYSAAPPANPAFVAAAPGTSAASVPLLDPTHPTWHQTTATDPVPAATPIPSATRFSGVSGTSTAVMPFTPVSNMRIPIAKVTNGNGTFPTIMGRSGESTTSAPIRCAHHDKSARTGDRRLDSARDGLRSLALRAAGDSRRGSSHAARLSHARNASGRCPNGRPLRQQRGRDAGFRRCGSSASAAELAGQGPAHSASRTGAIAGHSGLAAGQGRRVLAAGRLAQAERLPRI